MPRGSMLLTHQCVTHNIPREHLLPCRLGASLRTFRHALAHAELEVYINLLTLIFVQAVVSAELSGLDQLLAAPGLFSKMKVGSK